MKGVPKGLAARESECWQWREVEPWFNKLIKLHLRYNIMQSIKFIDYIMLKMEFNYFT